MGEILERGTLRVGYIKFPDNGYVYNNQAYGYELGLLNDYAASNNLILETKELTLENMSEALNINRIDIAIGGITPLLINSRLNAQTAAWDRQTIVVAEYRTNGKKSTFKANTITADIYVGKRLSSEKTLTKLQAALPESTILSGLRNEHDLLEDLESNKINYLVTTLARLRIIQNHFPNIRRAYTFKNQKENMIWMLPKTVDLAFKRDIEKYLSSTQAEEIKRALFNNYYKKIKHFHFVDSLKFKEHIETRLPKYEQWFRLAAKEYDLNWTLLAALAYQESKWTVDAVSPTKVRGIMQITTQTAKELGIDNRLDPFSTIFGAAKYLRDLRKRIPKRVHEPDRTRMAVGSYNIGFGYILDCYKEARKGNFNTITWKDIEKCLPTAHQIKNNDYIDNNHYFSRGFQAIKYVARVEAFEKILRHYASE